MTPTHRLVIFNTVAAAFVVWAWMLGYVQQVFNGDISHMAVVGAITAMFAFGMLSVALRARELAAGKLTPAVMQIKQAHLWDTIEWVVLLSLVGNAVGLYKASRNIDVASLSSTDGMLANVAIMLSGTGVAVAATIVGGIACLVLWINVRIVDTATRLKAEEVQ